MAFVMPDLPVAEVVLLCDDVRREFSGKDIIIGVYSDEITVMSLPATLVFCLYIRARFPEKNKNYEIEFRVLGDTGQQLIPIAKTTINSQNTPRSTISFGGIPLHIQSEGEVQFQWRPQAAEWITLVQLNVKQGAVIPPAGMIIGSSTPA
jgi:hypothetical protein